MSWEWNWTYEIKDYQYIDQITRKLLHFYYSSKSEADKKIDEINDTQFTFYRYKRVSKLGKKMRDILYKKYNDYNDFIGEIQCGKKLNYFLLIYSPN